MPFLPITATAAAVLGLIYIALSARVVLARGKSGASLGDGGGIIASGQEHTVPLLVAARTHANFAEYVPLCLILLGLVEAEGTRRWLVIMIAVLLVVARMLHPIGMGRRIPNPFRAGGIVLTFSVITISSIALLVHAVT